MTSFLPSAASLPVPISTVCSKRKKAALLRLGERKTVKKYAKVQILFLNGEEKWGKSE
jgi:hypothetical protein